MALQKVVIVGRPNVGKSSLFNALAGSPISIVEPTPGVTRDRVSAIICTAALPGEKEGVFFELFDTGGYGVVDSDHLSEQIEQQIHQAVVSADLIIFVVDIREGLMPLDKEVARILRKEFLDSRNERRATGDPATARSFAETSEQRTIIGVANKADEAAFFPAAAEFNSLGFGDFLCVSAANNINKKVLLDRILDFLPKVSAEKPHEPVMKIAVVGKRNAGKSSLVNAIVGDNRVIVSEVPGTTRDAVDIRFDKDGKTVVIIDTAGARKKSSMKSSIEFYGYVRAQRAVRRADIVFLIIDATVPVSGVDGKLAKLICDEYKSCIIVVNKWDLAKDRAKTGDYKDYLTKVLPELKNAPIAFTTATQAKNIQSLLDLSFEIFKQATTWIPTPKLNKALEAIKADSIVTTRRGGASRPKVYYAAQIAVNPVTILLFVNKPELFEENYRKYIIGRLQSLLPVDEVPIRLIFRSHRKNTASDYAGGHRLKK